MSKAPRQGVALITGASGFIGRRLRDALLEQGHDVVALVRKGSPQPSRGRAVEIDYADVESLQRALEQERPELVFHVAGTTKGVHYSDFELGNVMPTRNLGIALRKAHDQIGRFLHVSSLTAYGPSLPGKPLVESDERKPIEHYGKSKLAAELVLEQEIGGTLPWTMIRPAGVYGPGDVDYFVLFQLASRRLNVFYGNRNALMSMVHVDDVVGATLAAARSSNTIGKGYFICDGAPRSWAEMQTEIVALSGKRALNLELTRFAPIVAASAGELMTRLDGKPRLFNKQRVIMGQQLAWTCTHGSALRDFEYRPTLPMREGLAHTYEWYKSAGWL